MLNSTHDKPCFISAGNYIQGVSYVRKMLKSYNMYSFSRISFFHWLIVIVRHEFDLTFMQSTHKNIFYSQSTFLYNYGCCYLPRFFVDVRLDYNTLCWHGIVFQQIDSLVCHLNYFLSQNVEISFLFCTDGYTNLVTSQLLWNEVMSR